MTIKSELDNARNHFELWRPDPVYQKHYKTALSALRTMAWIESTGKTISREYILDKFHEYMEEAK